jgi:pyruvate,water dikinase
MKKDNCVLAAGMIVSPGQVTGPVKIVKESADVKKIGKGDIMVVSQSNPAFALGVMNASGLICEKGGMMTHICIVAKELGIPCLTQVKNALQLLEENMIVSIDASAGVVSTANQVQKN